MENLFEVSHSDLFFDQKEYHIEIEYMIKNEKGEPVRNNS